MLLLVAVPLAMTFAGCSTFTDKMQGAAAPQTNIPRECERIAKKKVPAPKIAEGDDLGDIAARYKAAFHKSEKKSEAVAKCEERQGDEFAKGAR